MAGTGRRRMLGAVLVGALLGVAGLGSPVSARGDTRPDCDRRATGHACSQQAPCQNGARSTACRDCYYEQNPPCRDCYYEQNRPCRECYDRQRPCGDGRPQSCPDCYGGGRDGDCYDRCDDCYRGGDDEASEDDDYADDDGQKDSKDERKSDDPKKEGDKANDDKQNGDKQKDDKQKDDNKERDRSRVGRLVREIFD